MAELVPVTSYDEMIDALVQDELSTVTEVQDLTSCVYERDSDFGSLEFKGRPGRLGLTEWSARQLCKLAGIPFGVWKKSSGHLAQDMLTEFLPNLKDPNRKLVLKTYGTKTVVRGVLNIEYPDIRNSEILKSVSFLNRDFVVESAGWMEEKNAPFFRTRFVFKDLKFTTADGEELFLGVDVTSSELGGGPLSVNLELYRLVCKNGMTVLYGRKPYFHFNYESAMMIDVADLMKAAMNRLDTDAGQVQAAVEAAKQTPMTKLSAGTLLDKMVKDNIINKGLYIKTLAEIEEKGVTSKWDVVQAITAVARGYRDMLRMRYESAGGLLLGLNFARSAPREEEFATQVLALPALPNI